MTTETNDQPEPIIWFEGTLISSPRQNRSAEDWLLETMAMGTATRKITITPAAGSIRRTSATTRARDPASWSKAPRATKDQASTSKPQASRSIPAMTNRTGIDDTDHHRQRHQTGQGRRRRMDRHQRPRRPTHVHAHGRRPAIQHRRHAGRHDHRHAPPTPEDAEAAGGDAQAETEPADGRITSRKTLYDRFRARLKENLAERKQ